MTISSLWKKFRSQKYRHAFVEAQLKRGVPTQIRAMRLSRGWKQKELADRCGLGQGTISRIENPDDGQLSFETVLAVARGFDCAFVGRLVPFSQLRALVEDSPEDVDLAPSFEQEDASDGQSARASLRLATSLEAGNIFSKPPIRAGVTIRVDSEAVSDVG